MCPVSGLVQFLIVIVTLLLICHSVVVKSLSISFTPKNVSVFISEYVTVEYEVTNITDDDPECYLYSESPHVANLEKNIIINHTNKGGSFNITGNFLGQTVISCKSSTTQLTNVADKVDVKCLRKPRTLDKIFTGSVATLVAIIYINFGCAVKWNELKKLLRRPVGPVIGFGGQFVIMPLLSYGIGYVIFPEEPEMRLGMFFTGVSPAGGASNVWTAILDGNIDLSILMTTISTIAAFGMMPAWLFTLGRTIFKDAKLEVPYSQISTYVFALVVPLAIGYLIRRYLKRTGEFLARILKGFSAILILFIVIFAIVANWYLFQLFSWRIVVAGLGLPWFGYILGYIMAKLLRQPAPDALAIAIETGIQNTGIAIFLLRFALEPLHADLTTVVPVSVAIMTPFPLMLMFVYKKLRERWWPHEKLESHQELCQKSNGTNNNHHRQDSGVACLS